MHEVLERSRIAFSFRTAVSNVKMAMEEERYNNISNYLACVEFQTMLYYICDDIAIKYIVLSNSATLSLVIAIVRRTHA